MSLIKTIRHQLGLSVTPANNFTLDASADNGTMKLARGNAGATTQDIMTVDAAGKANFNIGLFGFTFTSNANGMCLQLPSWCGGLKIQKGYQTGGTGDATITFPVAFADGNYALTGTMIANSYQSQYAFYIITRNTSNCTIYKSYNAGGGGANLAAGEPVSWIAIGQ